MSASAVRRGITMFNYFPFGKNRDAYRAHLSRVGGAYHVSSKVLLKRSQYRVVFERASLYNNFFAKLRGI